MRKGKMKKLLSSFLGENSSEYSQWLEANKKDVEEDLKRLLELIKEEKRDGENLGNPEERSLTPLIDGIHQKYRSLYENYDRLAGNLLKNMHQNGIHDDSSSSSSSDSETERTNKEKRKNKKGGRKVPDKEYQSMQEQLQNLGEKNRELEIARSETEKWCGDLKREIEVLRKELELKNEKENELNEKLIHVKSFHSEAEKAKKLEMENGALKKDLQAADQNVSELRESLTGANKEINAAIKRMEQMEEDSKQLQSEMERLKYENLKWETENKSLKLDLESVNQLIFNLKQKLEEKSVEQESLRSENVAWIKQMEEKEKMIHDLNNEIQLIQRKNSSLSAEKEELRESLTGANMEINAAVNRMEQMEEDSKQLQSENLKWETENKSLKLDLESVNQLILNLKQKLEEKGVEQESLRSENVAWIKQMEEKEKMIRDLNNEIQLIQRKNSSLSAEKEQLQSQLTVVKEEVNEIKRTIESEKTKDMNKLYLVQTSLEEYSTKLGEMKEENLKLLLDNDNLKSELNRVLQERTTEIASLSEQIQFFEVETKELKQKLELFHTHKLQLEEQIKQKNNEIAEHVVHKEGINQDFMAKIERFHALVKEREEEYAQLHISHRELDEKNRQSCDEIQTKQKVIEELEEAKQRLLTRINELQSELGLTQNQKGEMEKKLKENEENLIELEALKNHLNVQLSESLEKILNFEKMLKVAMDETHRMQDEITNLLEKHDEMQNQALQLEGEIRTKNIEISKNETVIFELKSVVNHRERSLQEHSEKIKMAELRIEELFAETVKTKADLNDLKTELEFTRNQKGELEDNIEKKSREILDLKVRIEELTTYSRSKSAEHETILKEKEESFNELHINHRQLEEKNLSMEKKHTELEEERTNLTNRVNDLEREIELIQCQKSYMEESLAETNENYQKLQKKHEEVNEKLEFAINDLRESQMTITKKEDTILALEIATKNKVAELESNQNKVTALGKEIADMGETFQKIDLKLKEMETEKLQLEKKERDQMQEIAKLQLQVQDFETQLRLANRKLQITEAEVKDEELKCQEIEKKLQMVETVMNKRIQELGQKTQVAMEMFCELEASVMKYEERHRFVRNQISLLIKEVQVAKLWVSEKKREMDRKNIEVKDLKEILSGQKQKLESTEVLVLNLQDEIGNLKQKSREDQREMEKLRQRGLKNESEIEELIMKRKELEDENDGVKEEKKEAIRQLCVCIEYHRENFDHVVSLLASRMPRMSQA